MKGAKKKHNQQCHAMKNLNRSGQTMTKSALNRSTAPDKGDQQCEKTKKINTTTTVLNNPFVSN